MSSPGSVQFININFNKYHEMFAYTHTLKIHATLRHTLHIILSRQCVVNVAIIDSSRLENRFIGHKTYRNAVPMPLPHKTYCGQSWSYRQRHARIAIKNSITFIYSFYFVTKNTTSSIGCPAAEFNWE